jgi:hypothetical protein
VIHFDDGCTCIRIHKFITLNSELRAILYRQIYSGYNFNEIQKYQFTLKNFWNIQTRPLNSKVENKKPRYDLYPRLHIPVSSGVGRQYKPLIYNCLISTEFLALKSNICIPTLRNYKNHIILRNSFPHLQANSPRK